MIRNTIAVTIVITLVSIFIDKARSESVATYELVFTKLWYAETHPTDYPEGNAHFSGLAGATHTSDVSFWNPGELATTGIKDIAERGNKTAFISEVYSAMNDGPAGSLLSYAGISGTRVSRTETFKIRESFPLATIVSMLAPSPDWFVGITSFDMRLEGQWIASAHFDLLPWDAGTDNGTTFLSDNLPAVPRQPIQLLDTFPFEGTGPVASFDLRLLSELESPRGDFDYDGDVDGRDFLTWQRNRGVGRLADWRANFGGALSSASTVPEPSSSMLLLTALMVFRYSRISSDNKMRKRFSPIGNSC